MDKTRICWLAMIVGCGGPIATSVDPGGQSGDASGSGSAGAGGSTNEAGAVRGRGALSLFLTLSPNSMAGTSCPPGAHWINVPFAPAGGQQTTAVNKGSMAEDGVGEMGVSCTVKDNGGVFNISAALESPAFDVQGN